MKRLIYFQLVFFTLLFSLLYLVKYREVNIRTTPNNFCMEQYRSFSTSDDDDNKLSSTIKESQQNLQPTIFAQISSQNPRNKGLQLEFVEKENLTEINILMTEFNSSFPSLITVLNTLLLENYFFSFLSIPIRGPPLCIL